MKSIVVSLLLWINANSQYEYFGEPPVVRTTDPESLVYLVLGEIPRMPARAKGAIRGMYDADTKTIWLRDDFNPDDPENLSHLVHELVHFLQYQPENRAVRPCGRLLEREAYGIQNKYLKAHHLPGLERKLVQTTEQLSGCGKNGSDDPA